jgi:hypothetical protein
MRNGPKRWEVTRWVFSNRPYRVYVEPAQLRLLEIRYLEFVRTPQTRVAIEEMLRAATDCPAERIEALRMTLMAGLFLAGRTGRGGRLIDWARGEDGRTIERLTDLGVTWLLSVGEENQDAEAS